MNTSYPVGTPTRAGRRAWIGLGILTLPTLLLSLDFSALLLALPRLSAELQPSTTQQLWIANIHLFMIAGLLITMGTLGDRLGRRRLLLSGSAAFGVGSLLAAFATSPQMLIGARALVGIAGATLMPSILALISAMFPVPRQKAVAIAVFMSCFMSGSALGPLVGGALLQYYWWGSVFLLGVPVMLLLLMLGPVLLPEYRNASAGRLDLASVVLSLAALLPVVYGITQVAQSGWQGLPIATILVGLAFGAGFVFRQRMLADQVMDLRLFRNLAFTGALVVLLLGPAVVGGVGLFSNQFLQIVEGLSPLQTGLWLLPSTLASVLGAMLAPLIARRIRPGYVVSAGGLFMATGGVLLTQVESADGLPTLIPGLVLILLGFGPIAALGTGLVVGAAPPEKAGSAGAMSETSGQLGVGLGVAVLGSVGAVVYRGQIADAIPPELPQGAAEAAHSTLPGAMVVSQQLPAPLAEALIGPAREAFTSGMNTAATLIIGIGILIALVGMILIRRERPTDNAAVPESATAGPEVAAAAGPVEETATSSPAGRAVRSA